MDRKRQHSLKVTTNDLHLLQRFLNAALCGQPIHPSLHKEGEALLDRINDLYEVALLLEPVVPTCREILNRKGGE